MADFKTTFTEETSNFDTSFENVVTVSGGGTVSSGVTSVNGKDGNVILSASDVGAYTIDETNEISESIKNELSETIETKADAEAVENLNTALTEQINTKANTADVYSKSEINDITGDIETALDNIISIQNELLGGEN